MSTQSGTKSKKDDTDPTATTEARNPQAKRNLWGVALAFVCFLPKPLLAQLPEGVLPEGVGVNIHFVKGHEKDLDMIAAAGCKFVRMDFTWGAIERTKGKYDWSEYEELTANLRKRGIRPIYILDYTHSAYEEEVETKHAITQQPQRDTASPRHPASIEAFARWAAAAAKHFHGEPIVWEIFNEPNGFFWKPKPNAEEYSALAVAVGKAVREAEPAAIIIAPALSGFDWNFFETCFKAGLLENLDGVSVHPYREPINPPETTAPDYRRLREMIERYAPAEKKKKLVIISGEWGYSSHEHGVSPETQAAYLVRQQLHNLLRAVPISIWYDWKNDGRDGKENEHNFGTVTEDLSPKPAYLALQKMTSELGGYHVVRRIESLGEDFLVLFAKGREQKAAVWTTGAPHEAKVNGLSCRLEAMPKFLKLEPSSEDHSK